MIKIMKKKFKKHAWAYSAWQEMKDGDKLLGRVRYDIELTKEAEGYNFIPKVDINIPNPLL